MHPVLVSIQNTLPCRRNFIQNQHLHISQYQSNSLRNTWIDTRYTQDSYISYEASNHSLKVNICYLFGFYFPVNGEITDLTVEFEFSRVNNNEFSATINDIHVL